ncbi:phosphatidate cytidylyltransferase [Catalinimonas niigatensis]|uniref:phosphatidate cytidylyltransferase n=1 Tax=Catalinimonas niigatensis TaxID=1397264 RepID=UPI0026659937|nr:phosphatidate cytidylyltransferase [Catalinimonas niigatensis]WPP48514.1 phosphatidate cytidylyltransferase [Catalinimonas niigatensis]
MISVLNKYNNITQRVITAIVGILIIIFSVYFSMWSYFALFFSICVLSQLEFYKLTGLDGMLPLKSAGTFAGGLTYCLSFFIESGMLEPKYYLLIFPATASIFFIKLYKKSDKKPFTNIAYTLCGIFYVAVPFALLNVIAFSRGEYSFQIVLGILSLFWASDSGAYFAGVKYGRTQLFARVSPKKSWEGSIGGAVTALLTASLLSLFYQDLDSWQWLIVGAIIVVAGTYGDLVESLFKRSIAIKDSGSKLPGHGGFLDRFDGLLISSHFIMLFLKIF